MTTEKTGSTRRRSELAKLKGEVAELRSGLEALRRELASCQEVIADLYRSSLERPAGGGASLEPASPAELTETVCRNYLDVVSINAIVREVHLMESGGTMTMCTVVDNPPPEGAPERAKYDEQLDTLDILRNNMPFDFYVMSVQQLAEEKDLAKMLQAEARLIWERKSG